MSTYLFHEYKNCKGGCNYDNSKGPKSQLRQLNQFQSQRSIFWKNERIHSK